MSNTVSLVNTYFDIAGLTLWAEKGDFEQTPRMLLSFADGRPRFVVYPGEKGQLINFPCNTNTMLSIVQAIEIIANGENGKKISIPSLKPEWVNNERTNNKVTVSTLHIAKTNNGIVALSVMAEGKPKIGFALNGNEWHGFRDENEEKFSASRESVMTALSFASCIKSVVLRALYDYTFQAYAASDYKPTEMKSPDQLKADREERQAKWKNNKKSNWNNNNNNNADTDKRSTESQWKDNTNNGNSSFGGSGDIDSAMASFDADVPF